MRVGQVRGCWYDSRMGCVIAGAVCGIFYWIYFSCFSITFFLNLLILILKPTKWLYLALLLSSFLTLFTVVTSIAYSYTVIYYKVWTCWVSCWICLSLYCTAEVNLCVSSLYFRVLVIALCSYSANPSSFPASIDPLKHFTNFLTFSWCLSLSS